MTEHGNGHSERRQFLLAHQFLLQIDIADCGCSLLQKKLHQINAFPVKCDVVAFKQGYNIIILQFEIEHIFRFIKRLFHFFRDRFQVFGGRLRINKSADGDNYLILIIMLDGQKRGIAAEDFRNLSKDILQQAVQLSVAGADIGDDCNEVFKISGLVPFVNRLGGDLLNLLNGKGFAVISYVSSGALDNFFDGVVAVCGDKNYLNPFVHFAYLRHSFQTVPFRHPHVYENYRIRPFFLTCFYYQLKRIFAGGRLIHAVLYDFRAARCFSCAAHFKKIRGGVRQF